MNNDGISYQFMTSMTKLLIYTDTSSLFSTLFDFAVIVHVTLQLHWAGKKLQPSFKVKVSPPGEIVSHNLKTNVLLYDAIWTNILNSDFFRPWSFSSPIKSSALQLILAIMCSTAPHRQANKGKKTYQTRTNKKTLLNKKQVLNQGLLADCSHSQS